MEGYRVKIDSEACVGCGACVKACAAKNIAIDNRRAVTIAEECIFCGH